MLFILTNANNLMQILLNDTNNALKNTNEATDELKPYCRRVFVRTFFVFVEGVCFSYRHIMINCSELEQGSNGSKESCHD
jgi:hypothetical protein